MITKVLLAAAIAGLAGAGAAAPAFAEPGSFGDISCSCDAPAPQAPLIPHFFVAPQGAIDQGIQQGLTDTHPEVAPR